VLPLASFGTMKFTNAHANGRAIGRLNPNEIITETSGGVIKAEPSTLGILENFLVTWHRS
jgi:hypothetical protein